MLATLKDSLADNKQLIVELLADNWSCSQTTGGPPRVANRLFESLAKHKELLMREDFGAGEEKLLADHRELLFHSEV